MIEVDYRIPVIGNNRIVEAQRSESPPVSKSTPLAECRTTGRAFVRHLNAESERALGTGISSIENVRHDLVAEIETFTFHPQLAGWDQQPHELGRS